MSALFETNFVSAVAPAILMVLAAATAHWTGEDTRRMWRQFNALALFALVLAVVALVTELVAAAVDHGTSTGVDGWLAINQFGAWVSVLVQLLGAAVGIYSSKHLEGEPRQGVYVTSLAAVLAAVHLLLLANHWVVLIAAWAAIEWAMYGLLCFYKDRPFALLAAHKKLVTDLAVDVLLIVAAALAWSQVGSGSFSALWAYIAAGHTPPQLVWSGVCLALAVIARTALMPVHGWLVQVMEAPTPVSALLHAGVVNLGGYVLVLFAPLLGVSIGARWLLVVFGLLSATVAGTVLLTRVSQKVHLAWSTIAQMGFMLLECGLGLYLFAALHLLGHSLYKAHNFLNASSAVKECKRKIITGEVQNAGWSMVLAIPVALAIVFGIQLAIGRLTWPWWWSAVLALAWAPLLWIPRLQPDRATVATTRLVTALGMTVFLTIAALVVGHAPVGAGVDALPTAGEVALCGMALLYLVMVAFQLRPHAMATFRRWVYAGLYMDEGYTHWVLRLWPAHWADADREARRSIPSSPRRSPRAIHVTLMQHHGPGNT